MCVRAENLRFILIRVHGWWKRMVYLNKKKPIKHVLVSSSRVPKSCHSWIISVARTAVEAYQRVMLVFCLLERQDRKKLQVNYVHKMMSRPLGWYYCSPPPNKIHSLKKMIPLDVLGLIYALLGWEKKCVENWSSFSALWSWFDNMTLSASPWMFFGVIRANACIEVHFLTQSQNNFLADKKTQAHSFGYTNVT